MKEKRAVQNTARKKFMYTGSTLPGGLLRSGAVFSGTREEITAYLAPVLDKHPDAKKHIKGIGRNESYG